MFYLLETSSYISTGVQGAPLALGTIHPLHRKTGLERKLTNRLLQVAHGLQELLGRLSDQALPEVHSLVGQLVLWVLGAQGCQDPLEDPGPPLHHRGPVVKTRTRLGASFQYFLTQVNSTMTVNALRPSLRRHWVKRQLPREGSHY